MTLWKHQEDAVQFALRQPRGGVLFAMEMRTGKTRAAIETMKRRGVFTALILCPKTVVPVWRDEMRAQWPDGPRVVLLQGDGTAKQLALKKALSYERPFIAVTNYEAAWRAPLSKHLAAVNWGALVLDECHRIKLPTGRASRFVGEIARGISLRIGLTGTPIPHSPLDIWAQYRALDPSIYESTFTAFRRHYSRPAIPREYRDRDTFIISGRGGQLSHFKYTHIDDLTERYERVAFRVRTEDVLDMPPIVDTVREVELEPAARKAYYELERDMITSIKGGTVTAANAGVALLRLQQCTGGTLVSRDSETKETTEVEISTAKADALRDIIADAGDEPLVVFARFHHDLDTIARVCADLKVSTSELSGRTNALQGWQAGETQVLAVQIQAGGVGIDLTRAAVAVYLSLGFDLAQYEQSRWRLRGSRQTRPVQYLHLVAARTVDQAIYKALTARQQVVGAIVDGYRDEDAA